MRTVVGVRSDTWAASSAEQPTHAVWFGTWRLLVGVLSDENRALLRLMREQKHRTARELAEFCQGAQSAICRARYVQWSYGLVRLNRNPETRSVRPEALATEFLVVLD